MPVQNRVDPFSAIHAVAERGLFTGNRGLIHDSETQTLKHQRWASDSWVICALKPPPTPLKQNSSVYGARCTNLFFLDEAVGLAAGHRPCHVCRKEEAKSFRLALDLDRVSAVNALINQEMKRYLTARGPHPRPVCNPASLPDGAFFSVDGAAFLKWRGAAYPFHFKGYGAPQNLPPSARRLTPQGTCQALANGFEPVLHPSLHRH